MDLGPDFTDPEKNPPSPEENKLVDRTGRKKILRWAKAENDNGESPGCNEIGSKMLNCISKKIRCLVAWVIAATVIIQLATMALAALERANLESLLDEMKKFKNQFKKTSNAFLSNASEP